MPSSLDFIFWRDQPDLWLMPMLTAWSDLADKLLQNKTVDRAHPLPRGATALVRRCPQC